MNKRILISLSIIGVVAALGIGGTIAYFSDVETSVGNTFAAGSLDLKIDSHCSLNGVECLPYDGLYYWDLDGNGEIGDGEVPEENRCSCSWLLADLDGKAIFDFEDLNPGDYGESTISLHSASDVWACMALKDWTNIDNGCVGPEVDPDPDCNQVGDQGGQGELIIEFALWWDMCDIEEFGVYPGDNIYQIDCDGGLGPYSVYSLAEIVQESPLPIVDSEYSGSTYLRPDYLEASTTYYIGMAWCFGGINWIYKDTGVIACDGSGIGNEAQTDKLTGTIEFSAWQYRSNPDFFCRDIQ